MMKSNFYYKELTSAEVGTAGTHEVYIRMPNGFDYETFFGNAAVQNGSVKEVNFQAIDITNGGNDIVPLRFVYFENSNKEKRIPSLAPLFKKNNVTEGDIVCLESRQDGNTKSYYIRFYKKGKIQISPASIYFTQNDCDLNRVNLLPQVNFVSSHFRPYITAIKSKPFLLLAGISGTGKSRIVRELARACWDGDDAEFQSQKPRNFEMIQVKPNWHDSSELIGYVSRVSGTPMFVAGDFLKFIARAWEEPDVPYFLCLDEMNLAPVEQYFAEYLSVIESRKADADGNITTDPILKKSAEDWFRNLTNELTVSDGVRSRFLNEGISIPQNLIVVGTVNMDETTFSFSRKVLDRAMTIEMNEVDLHGGLSCKNEQIGKLGKDELVGTDVEGVDIYESNKEVCDKALDYLQKVNDRLEGTPFKIAYRTRNEVLLYVVNNLPYKKENETQDFVVARALDEITNMKILSRIEGDETKVSTEFFNALESAVKSGLEEVCGSLFAGDAPYNAISLAKLGEMKKRLASGYTSFWS